MAITVTGAEEFALCTASGETAWPALDGTLKPKNVRLMATAIKIAIKTVNFRIQKSMHHSLKILLFHWEV
jgi:hypothetical protein